MNDTEYAVTNGGANYDNAVSAGTIVEKYGERICENGSCLRERDAVFVEVGSSLGVVPLEIAFRDRGDDMSIMG